MPTFITSSTFSCMIHKVMALKPQPLDFPHDHNACELYYTPQNSFCEALTQTPLG